MLVATAIAALLCMGGDPGGAQTSYEGKGRVVAVDETQRTVTLDHGPIAGLMPPMRMAFPAQQIEQFVDLRVGALVRFSLQARGPKWVIASIEPVMEPPRPNLSSFPAPDFAVPTLSGAAIRLSDLRGKVVLINFWVTWCGPCRAEMSALDTLYRRYKDRGLEVLAVNLDTVPAAKIDAFVGELGTSLRVALDPSSSTARTYQVLGLPSTYLIDRAGNVVVREIGGRNWLDGISKAAVEGLLQ